MKKLLVLLLLLSSCAAPREKPMSDEELKMDTCIRTAGAIDTGVQPEFCKSMEQGK